MHFDHVRPHHALGMRVPVAEVIFEKTASQWPRHRGLDYLVVGNATKDID